MTVGTMINKKASILIVDDDEQLRWLLAKCLGCYYTCATAGSGDEATQMLGSTHFELVITEIRMPGTSGLELCQFVNKTCSDTAVLLISEPIDALAGLQALDSGACDYVLKPLDLAGVLESVERALQQQVLLAGVRTALGVPAKPRRLAAAASTNGNNAEHAERRGSIRVPYLCEVQCEGIDFGTLTTRINDLSTGGVFIDAETPFPVGSSFAFKFRVPDKEVRVTGEVRYTMPKIGMGVRFVDLGAEDLAAISSVVEDLARMNSYKYATQFGLQSLAFD
jgi:uncharacterized protein (TIGR02266 family)